MSRLEHLLTRTIILSRLNTVSGYKQAFATVTAGLAALQPLSPAKTQLYDGVMGKTFKIYTSPDFDIQEGDKIKDLATGKLYKVRNGGVSRRTMGSIDYNDVVVEEIN